MTNKLTKIILINNCPCIPVLVDISDTAMVVVVIVVVGTGPNIINKIPSRFIANITTNLWLKK